MSLCVCVCLCACECVCLYECVCECVCEPSHLFPESVVRESRCSSDVRFFFDVLIKARAEFCVSLLLLVVMVTEAGTLVTEDTSPLSLRGVCPPPFLFPPSLTLLLCLRRG